MQACEGARNCQCLWGGLSQLGQSSSPLHGTATCAAAKPLAAVAAAAAHKRWLDGVPAVACILWAVLTAWCMHRRSAGSSLHCIALPQWLAGQGMLQALSAAGVARFVGVLHLSPVKTAHWDHVLLSCSG